MQKVAISHIVLMYISFMLCVNFLSFSPLYLLAAAAAAHLLVVLVAAHFSM